MAADKIALRPETTSNFQSPFPERRTAPRRPSFFDRWGRRAAASPAAQQRPELLLTTVIEGSRYAAERGADIASAMSLPPCKSINELKDLERS